MFSRMALLSREIVRVMMEEFGPGEVVNRVREADRERLGALRRLGRYVGG